MKATLFCILLVLSGILSAQTIDNPPFKARSGSISNITRIERTPESTRVYIHAIFRPHWWIKEKGTSYLEDATTGKKYKFKGAEGIEINKATFLAALSKSIKGDSTILSRSQAEQVYQAYFRTPA